MTLSEHLYIHLPLAYKEVATAELYKLIFEFHENVMESNSGRYTYFKDQAQTGYRIKKKDYLSNKRKAFSLKEWVEYQCTEQFYKLGT